MLFLWRGSTREGQERSDVNSLLIRLQNYARTHYADSPLRILVDEYGGENTVYWFREHADLVSRKQAEQTMSRDEAWSRYASDCSRTRLTQGCSRARTGRSSTRPARTS
jgi:hypothetical protein